jgi:PAS domain-containing protein
MIEQLLREPGFMMNVFEAMRDALMVMDKDGNIIFFNKAAEEMTGYGTEEVLGKSCTMLDTDTCVVLTDSGRQRNCGLFRTAGGRETAASSVRARSATSAAGSGPRTAGPCIS